MAHPRFVGGTEVPAAGAAFMDNAVGDALSRVATTGDREDLVQLLGALGTLMQAWDAPVCEAMQAACLRVGGSEVLPPSAFTACGIMFGQSGFEPSEAWCSAAISAVSEQLGVADGQELSAFLACCVELPALRAATSEAMLGRVMEAAATAGASNALAPAQLVAVLSGAAKLAASGGGAEALCGATPANSSMLQTALNMRDMLGPQDLCELVGGV